MSKFARVRRRVKMGNGPLTRHGVLTRCKMCGRVLFPTGKNSPEKHKCPPIMNEHDDHRGFDHRGFDPSYLHGGRGG